MAIKKYTNGSWVPASFRKYGTETDAITTLPATVIGDGTPISSYIIKGNMVQSGTPTPSSPIYPSECGERTANLVYKTLIGTNIKNDGQIIVNSNFNLAIAKVVQGETYSISNGSGIMAFYIDEPVVGTYSVDNMRYDITPTVTIPQGANYIAFRYITPATPMLNSGSTALPYEPYGYKLPITLGSTTTDIYLGEVQSTRRIRKLVLTGEEAWSLWSSGQPDVERYYCKWGKTTPSDYGLICTHFPFIRGDGNFEHVRLGGSNRDDFVIFISKTIAPTLADFKAFLAQQYANGTPVTVWYVLAEPETGIVNEPLMKLGDYVDSVSGTGLATSGTAQELNIETTLKPSEVDMTYHGWHEHEDTKYST